MKAKVLWNGVQWTVTTWGIEQIGNCPYRIKGERVHDPELRWEAHMAEKNWVDMGDFLEALRFARAHFREPARGSRGRRRVRQ